MRPQDGPYSLNIDFEHLNPLNNDSVHLIIYYLKVALKGPYSLNIDFEHLNPLNNDSVHLNQGLTLSLEKTDERTLKNQKKY
jgi:hypothetical protein